MQIKLTNWTGVTQKFTKIKVKTNAFATNWSYDLTNLTGGNLKAGESIGTDVEQEFSLPEPLEVRDGALAPQTYYMWVMPTNLTTGLKTTIYAINDKEKVIRALKRSTPVKEGLLTAHIKPIPDHPISYLKVEPLIGMEEPFSFASNGTAPTYYAPEEIYNLSQLGDLTIGVDSYYLPSEGEIRSLFHERDALGIGLSTAAITGGIKVDFNNVAFPWAPSQMVSGTSVYWSDRVALYGLRFKTDNARYLMAYKYEWFGDFTPSATNSSFKITSRYLGEDYKDASITTIANADFWANDDEEDVSVVLKTDGYIPYNKQQSPAGSNLLATSPIIEGGQNIYVYAKSRVTDAPEERTGSDGSKVLVYTARFFRIDKGTGMWGIRSYFIDQRPTRLLMRK